MRDTRYDLREHKTCPTCQYEETRMDAPYCSYCGGKHTMIVYSQSDYRTISIPVELDESMPDNTFRRVSRKRAP